MQRIVCPERDDWQATAHAMGFTFHAIGGERYWDERAYYGFTLDEIERSIEAPTGELDAMCRQLVARVVDSERDLRRLQIPQNFWTFIAASWKRGDASLYGRLDLRFDGHGPAKLLEYNADTPTSLFEAAVFQWTWLEQAIERQIIPRAADQYNSLHERLIARWAEVARGKPVHLAAMMENDEDAGTLAYLEDTARQAGLATTQLDVTAIGWRDDGHFVDLDERPMALVFKLYPWEWMVRETFGARLKGGDTRWIEPPWKMILSNKGILPLLWEMFPNHPNLLPAYFDDDPAAATLGTSYVRKPLYSREGANVTIVSGGETLVAEDGPYGSEGFIRQALAPLPAFNGQHPVLGSWLVGDTPCGLSIREDENPITGNGSRFVPHAIV
ncbi:glutathionylspermidine synthase family protein [Bradyrhizobium sp. U87765 SZCCT0131]|uniref:glutathionylspermidine synthase family protein n=1 Tax=unclassified Bradyrhizobium TaxID=2631580 RepID=UPI001BA9877F|nr:MULTISPECIES: glutathionylspermidine synthase family protein [unclassified Bradyrhizobium]MBR1222465.1 glutathionylspermidine synthase family protein [Bradyrhizobium sp. U87765 SZCCT0131]MBR1264051.1 glutathionylspermidine synthase family protein [Bradyrhizobium sp. U87765 SZCCT0134]MBR1308166.1 glutathionylspermidine synthase family protein [Bradyrhizobium sp. U87765 SZCCT0110]MBR1320301.1 glutathionylspermidine synthase family protein [Bradyrhizobium sp. U87765 SZCCT0109]MBR1348586.1 glut